MQNEKIFRVEVLRTLGDSIAMLRTRRDELAAKVGKPDDKMDRRIDALTVGYLFLVNHMPLGPA